MQHLAGTLRLQGRQVQHQVAHLQALARIAALRAQQQRLQAHFQFRQCEWFGQVVIRAGTEARDLVRQFVARGQHDHRHFRRMFGAQPPQHLRALHAWQHPVQDHRVIRVAARQVQAGDAVRGNVEHMPARLEIVEQVGHQLAVVLDHQQAHAKHPREVPPW
ncbi:hypothetical protein D3C73_871130 [compost metagenome]